MSPVLIIFHHYIKTSSVTGKIYISTKAETPRCILCQYLWFNKFIIVDNSFINFTNFSAKDINLVVSDLVNENCSFKSWETYIMNKKNII